MEAGSSNSNSAVREPSTFEGHELEDADEAAHELQTPKPQIRKEISLIMAPSTLPLDDEINECLTEEVQAYQSIAIEWGVPVPSTIEMIMGDRPLSISDSPKSSLKRMFGEFKEGELE